jgi:hypothetical protein
MAHAGTPTNLAQQPSASAITTLWQAVIAAILVLALTAGVIAVSANLAAKSPAVPATNPTYQIQSQPGLDVHKVVGHKGAMIYQ